MRLRVEQLIERTLFRNQIQADALVNVDVSFVQHLRQATRAAPLARLQRFRIMTFSWLESMQLHQQIYVEFIGIPLCCKVRRPQLLAANVGAHSLG